MIAVTHVDNSENLENSWQDEEDDICRCANENGQALHDEACIRSELATQHKPAPNGSNESGVVNDNEERLGLRELLRNISGLPRVHGSQAKEHDLVRHDHDSKVTSSSYTLVVVDRSERLNVNGDFLLDRVDEAIDHEKQCINKNCKEPVHKVLVDGLRLSKDGVVEDAVDSPGFDRHGNERDGETQRDDDWSRHAKNLR